MLYSVIFSVDTTQKTNLLPPPAFLDNDDEGDFCVWFKTEDDDQYEYDYLADDPDDPNDPYIGGHHGKWCAILTQPMFDLFVAECSLLAEDCQTMGSLGAPGFGLSLAPAISFRDDETEPGIITSNAYVTPIPEDDDGYTHPTNEDETAELWEQIRNTIISKYRDGTPWEDERKAREANIPLADSIPA